jgi:hypothetical protein
MTKKNSDKRNLRGNGKNNNNRNDKKSDNERERSRSPASDLDNNSQAKRTKVQTDATMNIDNYFPPSSSATAETSSQNNLSRVESTIIPQQNSPQFDNVPQPQKQPSTLGNQQSVLPTTNSPTQNTPPVDQSATRDNVSRHEKINKSDDQLDDDVIDDELIPADVNKHLAAVPFHEVCLPNESKAKCMERLRLYFLEKYRSVASRVKEYGNIELKTKILIFPFLNPDDH